MKRNAEIEEVDLRSAYFDRELNIGKETVEKEMEVKELLNSSTPETECIINKSVPILNMKGLLEANKSLSSLSMQRSDMRGGER